MWTIHQLQPLQLLDDLTGTASTGLSPTSPVSKHGSKAFVDDPPDSTTVSSTSASSLAFSSASAFASASAFTGLLAFVGPFSVPLLQDFRPLWVPFQHCQQLPQAEDIECLAAAF